MICDWCASAESEAWVQLGREDGDETTLCARCCDIAFPGVRDRMRHECPICSEESAHWN